MHRRILANPRTHWSIWTTYCSWKSRSSDTVAAFSDLGAGWCEMLSARQRRAVRRPSLLVTLGRWPWYETPWIHVIKLTNDRLHWESSVAERVTNNSKLASIRTEYSKDYFSSQDKCETIVCITINLDCRKHIKTEWSSPYCQSHPMGGRRCCRKLGHIHAVGKINAALTKMRMIRCSPK